MYVKNVYPLTFFLILSLENPSRVARIADFYAFYCRGGAIRMHSLTMPNTIVHGPGILLSPIREASDRDTYRSVTVGVQDRTKGWGACW